MRAFAFDDFDALLPKLAFDEAPCGGALTIFKAGECVLSTAFGQANKHHAWTASTPSVNFSVGKGVMASLIAVLVSRQLLDYDTPIAHYWKEFAAAAKDKITLAEVLSHRAVLFNIRALNVSTDEIADWHTMCARVADMSVDVPLDQAQKAYASAYSALVSGWILGGLVERVTGMGLQEALDTYLAAPLGVVGQLYFGARKAILPKLAVPYRLFDGDYSARSKPVLKPDSEEKLAFFNDLPIAPLWQAAGATTLGTQQINRLYFDSSQMNMANYKNALLPDGKTPINYHAPDMLATPIPAANGISTSQALATLYAMHAADGQWQDSCLIDSKTIARMRAVQGDAFDAVMPANMRWRLGFHRLFTLQSAPEAYGHMGYNGSVAFCDPKRQLALAFIHNFDVTMLNDVRQFVLSELALLAS